MKWIDPPVDARKTRQAREPRPGKYRDMANALKERPGEWALVLEAVNAGNVSRIKTGKDAVAFRPAGSFEAVSRKRPDGKFDIYARYVGEPDACR